MKGSIRQRSPGSWELTIDLGPGPMAHAVESPSPPGASPEAAIRPTCPSPITVLSGFYLLALSMRSLWPRSGEVMGHVLCPQNPAESQSTQRVRMSPAPGVAGI